MIAKHLVYVDGQEGTTGLKIHSMLAGRSDLELLSISPDKRKDPSERARLLNEADVSFLCLPDDAAREAAALVTNPKARLIDASTAHRTDPHWVYGLPELLPGHREVIAQSKRVSNPGCHATAFILLARPLMDARLLPAEIVLSATSITG
jgi:N-acetyl-gamma-glutamyl-phosphate reductase